MGPMLNEVFNEFIKLFQISRSENFEIKKIVGEGFSGAEVYLIELKDSSRYNGLYFLKIDTHSNEYSNLLGKYRFSKIATVVCSEIINNYYVLLIEIAGKSLMQYVSFYDIETLQNRKKAISTIIPNILDEAIQGQRYIYDEINASNLFSANLQDKLLPGSPLEKYVSILCNGKDPQRISGFCFEKGICFPNAYAFAKNDNLWHGIKVRNTMCAIHGDFHGNNLFFSGQNNDYVLIDLALYRDNGYMFYDVAYFELSLLLRYFESMKLIDWVLLVQDISLSDWENVSCKDKEVFVELHRNEELWINNNTSKEKSHKDILLESRIVARVIAGLNYAGKKNVDDEIRRKSYIYACVYLDYLLKSKKLENWKHNITPWNEILSRQKNDETKQLFSNLENFADGQRYVLVLGDKYNYAQEVYEAISRVHWTGIVSFKREIGIETTIKKYNILNAITCNNNLDMITSENMWCLYANGVAYDPTTIYDTFPRWRNTYSRFFSLWIDRLDSVIAPDELIILIDLNSFSNLYRDHLLRLCESLDRIENTSVRIETLLGTSNSSWIENNMYDKLICHQCSSSLESVAQYCLKYLPDNQEDELTIPAINNMRKTIPVKDYKFIKSYVSVLHNRIIQEEGCFEDNEKRSFYYGEKILWQAIEEHLFIDREEFYHYEQKIRYEISTDNNQFLIRIPHSPGAGASVLCRVLCWNYRNEYPTVLASKMNVNIVMSLQKLYSLSGKHILLFVDGDFSENDIDQLLHQSKYMGIKVGIIFPYKSYDGINDGLTILSTDDAITFSRVYSKQMKFLKNYSDDIIRNRYDNMHKLATEKSLINYRLPFFFGLNAFEDDYLSIQDYINDVCLYIDGNKKIRRIINYISLITYYTEDDGLNISYLRKLIKEYKDLSAHKIRDELNGDIKNLIYYDNGSFKICHSIVAYEILAKQFKMSSTIYEEFLENFVSDLCGCEGKYKTSDKLNNLFMNLFIKRDIASDVSDDQRKANFSPIILSLNNTNLQEKFFAFLSSEVPNNAHFKQHYGRLIIYNNPEKLAEAKEQLDKAISIEPDSPLHYHARGNMYTKYLMNLCRSISKEASPLELFNKIAQITECAISDYENSIRKVLKCNDSTMDLSYPYVSIIQTITYVVHQIYLRDTTEVSEKDFLELNTEVAKWCKKYIYKARQYDINTEVRYDIVRENKLYKSIRSHLTKYCLDTKEIEHKLEKRPDNFELMRDYLYSFDIQKKPWDKRSQKELGKIIDYCRRIINNDNDINDGLLWRWFNASLYYHRNNIVDMVGLLETIDNSNENLTIQFMLYVVKLNKYFLSKDDKTLNEVLNHIRKCKDLNKNSNRISTRYYYNGQSGIGFCHDKKLGTYENGTVIKWGSPQNGHVSLAIQPKLSAFFVPSIISMREEGAVGTEVRFKLGVSFDGLRAWDVEVVT